MSRVWAGACVVAVTVALSSCDDMGGFDRAREDFHYSYPMQPGGHLDVENTNGSVDISGWDRNEIDVSGTKYASTDDRLKEIRIKVDVTGNSALVATETPKEFMHGGFGARYSIHVPRQITLGRVQTTNGSFSVEDLQGGGHVKSTNGRISMARDEGDYDVQTTNGTIELNECGGAERAETTNGAIRGRLRTGVIEAHSTNGGIDFTLLKPSSEKPIRVSTTNGGITLALAEFHGNPITAGTTHGGVTLRLPADTSAQVTAETSVSGISSDLTLTSTGEMSKHTLRGRLGNGGAPISLRTTTGRIHIERY